MLSETMVSETLTPAQRAAVRKLVAIRALHLGDLLLAVPGLRAIRRGFPNAEITLVGLRWSSDFARRFGHLIDRWREFPGYPGLLEVDVIPERTAAFLEEERAYGYDLVLQMHGNGSVSNRFALEFGGKLTAGYYHREPPPGLWPCAPYPDHLPELERHLGTARMLGIPAEDRRLEYPIRPEEEAAFAAMVPAGLTDRRPIVALHAGARPSARRWPPEYFARVGDTLARRYGARIVLTGGPGEEPIAGKVAARMESEPVNLAGKTSLGALAALLRRCDLVISNDTGPSHVAVALDRPSVTIFGPADRRRWAPLDQVRHPIAYHAVECSPCPHWDCPIDHRCLRGVPPEQVLALATRLLAGEGYLPAGGRETIGPAEENAALRSPARTAA
jgi:ADP-heptose:LPS heptosyltransferase